MGGSGESVTGRPGSRQHPSHTSLLWTRPMATSNRKLEQVIGGGGAQEEKDTGVYGNIAISTTRRGLK